MGDRQITVKGVGRTAVRPDRVVVTLNLSTKDSDYAAASQKASGELDALREAVQVAGHKKESLKTTDFRVETEYDNVQDERGNWHREFSGYVCRHALKLEFALDMTLLDGTLGALSVCGCAPEISIAFTVADASAVSRQLLESAVCSAAERAKILASAAGVSLGRIAAINYDWCERNLVSPTCAMNSMMDAMPMKRSAMADIEPEDISVSDSVSVVWEIE